MPGWAPRWWQHPASSRGVHAPAVSKGTGSHGGSSGGQEQRKTAPGSTTPGCEVLARGAPTATLVLGHTEERVSGLRGEQGPCPAPYPLPTCPWSRRNPGRSRSSCQGAPRTPWAGGGAAPGQRPSTAPRAAAGPPAGQERSGQHPSPPWLAPKCAWCSPELPYLEFPIPVLIWGDAAGRATPQLGSWDGAGPPLGQRHPPVPAISGLRRLRRKRSVHILRPRAPSAPHLTPPQPDGAEMEQGTQMPAKHLPLPSTQNVPMLPQEGSAARIFPGKGLPGMVPEGATMGALCSSSQQLWDFHCFNPPGLPWPPTEAAPHGGMLPRPAAVSTQSQEKAPQDCSKATAVLSPKVLNFPFLATFGCCRSSRPPAPGASKEGGTRQGQLAALVQPPATPGAWGRGKGSTPLFSSAESGPSKFLTLGLAKPGQSHKSSKPQGWSLCSATSAPSGEYGTEPPAQRRARGKLPLQPQKHKPQSHPCPAGSRGEAHSRRGAWSTWGVGGSNPK